MRRTALLGLLLFALAGCSSNEEATTTNSASTVAPIWTPVPSLTAAPTLAPTATPPVVLVPVSPPPALGIPVVDAVSRAVAARDIDALMTLVQFGKGDAPPGTIKHSACGGAEDYSPQTAKLSLFAIFRLGMELDTVAVSNGFAGKYVLLFTPLGPNPYPEKYYAVSVNEVGIVWLIAGCTSVPRNWGGMETYRRQ